VERDEGGDVETSVENSGKSILLILNDPPYGTERSWNGLRLADSLARRDGVEVRVFLVGDAVGCAMADQKVPDGYYHLDRMILAVARHGGEVGCCGTCMDARGITEDMLTKGARRSSLEELADWTLWADEVVTF
jgi:uncharacterized protein involved in oxidation of intracellular sulfur